MNAPKLTTERKARIEAVLTRAAGDIAFRTALLDDPETALRGTDLSDDERAIFAPMRRVGLEEWGIDVRRFRAFLRDNGNKIS